MNANKLIIQEIIKNGVKTQAGLAVLKRKSAKKYKTSYTSNIALLKVYHKLVKNGALKINKKLEELLRIKKIRSLSGIAVVSVLTKPYPCPGNCIYCPTQKGIPKSYLDNEPAVMRAVLNKFKPYQQVQMRIKALENIGHPTDKIELIVIGGTWSYLPINYQAWFIKRCFDACNKKMSKNLAEAQRINENAKHRIIGITLETRPDFINKEEVKRMRKLGATRVELGVQSIYNNILDLNRRGHKIDATILATKLLKDAGFKVCYHMMPNLPGSNLKLDEKMFQELFSNPSFRPDLLKIYPCVVLKEAKLYQRYNSGKYKSYSKSQLIKLIKNIKKKIPSYVRIQRLIRDIPSKSIVAGCKISNLRQMIAQDMKKEGWRCNCIRCREVRGNYPPSLKASDGKLIQNLRLFRKDYDASGGKEIFLSYENKNRDKLYSLLRLRIPSFVPLGSTLESKPSKNKHFIPILQDAAIIREIHTYGQLVPISEKQTAIQHKGLGKKLIKTAEKIVKKEFNIKKIAVISGVGVRIYYKKLGYQLKNDYMVKNL